MQSTEIPINQILLGDSRKLLASLPSERLDLLWTSPPYALSVRVYTKDDPEEIGREDSVPEYLDALIVVAKEAKRVLRPWACQVWNIGDRFKNKRQLRIPEKFTDRTRVQALSAPVDLLAVQGHSQLGIRAWLGKLSPVWQLHCCHLETEQALGHVVLLHESIKSHQRRN